MPDIQIDMFEVGLGAAILLQLKFRNEVIRILADGGSTNRSDDHVHVKLAPSIRDFKAAVNKRLDLIVGTHYDADHLTGLVPIIADTSIEIGEAWLPPVANDSDGHALDEAPDDRHLLALQLMADDSGEVLKTYLRTKALDCERLADLERSTDDARANANKGRLQRRAEMRLERPDIQDVERYLAPGFFECHRADAKLTLNDDGDHASDEAEATAGEPEAFGDPFFYRYVSDTSLEEWTSELRRADSGRAESFARSLAYIRKAKASDAINATSLAAVVNALKARRIPIRCATIEDGVPRRFSWDGSARRFTPKARRGRSAGPTITLLGPSKGLVKKHWDKLPVSNLAYRAAMALLPLKRITASNQLSYVAKISHRGQSVLISGDSGFVDFSPEPRAPYFPALLEALDDLHVVQVAHHGGNNAHFYRVLLEAPFKHQNAAAYLLLSHEVDDKHRPSDLFSRFVTELSAATHEAVLLFSCRPQEKFVRDIKDQIGPVVDSPAASLGDVRLAFGDGRWQLKKHAVEIV